MKVNKLYAYVELQDGVNGILKKSFCSTTPVEWHALKAFSKQTCGFANYSLPIITAMNWLSLNWRYQNVMF